MKCDSTDLFQISVWRPARNERRMVYADTKEKSAENSQIIDNERLLEEIYCWSPGVINIFNGLKNLKSVEQIRSKFNKFAPNLPPEERSMDQFNLMVKELGDVILEPNSTVWTATEQADPVDSDETISASPMLAVLNHFEWMVRCFGDLPDASVLIR